MDACCRSGHSQMTALQSWQAPLAQLTCMSSGSQTAFTCSLHPAPCPWWATLWCSQWPLTCFPGRTRAITQAASCWLMQHPVVSWFPVSRGIAAACKVIVIPASEGSKHVSHGSMPCPHCLASCHLLYVQTSFLCMVALSQQILRCSQTPLAGINPQLVAVLRGTLARPEEPFGLALQRRTQTLDFASATVQASMSSSFTLLRIQLQGSSHQRAAPATAGAAPCW